ncbi:MAG TPA: gas vesicle protein [Mycobacteriales bacterium]
MRRGQGTAVDTEALRASRTAMDQLSALTGRDADSVSRLERVEDGWLLNVEVIELERIPQSTSVLGSYQVHTDDDGNITAYQRTRRYYRNQAGNP